jgi:hypothetical protein
MSLFMVNRMMCVAIGQCAMDDAGREKSERECVGRWLLLPLLLFVFGFWLLLLTESRPAS